MNRRQLPNFETMNVISLKACVLDRAGIPDLGDLRDTILDLDRILGSSFHLAIDQVDLERIVYYPYAAIETVDELVLIPMGRETRLGAAEDSLRDLRNAFE